MKRLVATALLIAACLTAGPASADTAWLTGRIYDVTSGPEGLDIRLDTGVPTNCTGVAYGWMTIPEANKTMIAVALIVWQNQGSATVYTNPLSNGACIINQFDPATPLP